MRTNKAFYVKGVYDVTSINARGRRYTSRNIEGRSGFGNNISLLRRHARWNAIYIHISRGGNYEPNIDIVSEEVIGLTRNISQPKRKKISDNVYVSSGSVLSSDNTNISDIEKRERLRLLIIEAQNVQKVYNVKIQQLERELSMSKKK